MEQICNDISENLKKIRMERGLSLEQLSELTGVSKSMLRQIETGNSVPTIATVWKIANGLKVSFTSLFSKNFSDVKVGRIKHQNALIELDGRYRVYPVIPFDPKVPFEIYFLEMEGGIRYDAEPHKGNVEEFVAVVEGCLEMIIDGNVFKIEKDEYISFFAHNQHSYINPAGETLKAVMVLIYH
ncbi:MAG: XRE family transcriptional regulator [Calditerrivibrio sp.]|nr:XRE family transcriptional regulator [Calditerrivibrio sp.]